MTLASLVLVIIRDIREIRGQILQPRISRMTRIMGTERLSTFNRTQFQRSADGTLEKTTALTFVTDSRLLRHRGDDLFPNGLRVGSFDLAHDLADQGADRILLAGLEIGDRLGIPAENCRNCSVDCPGVFNNRQPLISDDFIDPTGTRNRR